MKIKLCSYELSKMANHKSFSWSTNDFFYSDKTEGQLGFLQDLSDISKQDRNYILRPSMELLKQWFRDVHKIYINVHAHGPHSDYKGDPRYSASIYFNGDDNYLFYLNSRKLGVHTLKTYEEALENGLIKAFKLL